MAFSWLAGLVLCIFLHELGHAVAARFVGVEVKGIVIWLLGGFTNLSHRPENPLYNIALSAAGPLVNIVLGFLFVVGYMLSFWLASGNIDASTILWIQTIGNLFFSLAFLNMILVVFNLLPIYPLDGGNILHSLMELLFGRSNADWITMLVSIPILLCLIALGLYTRDYLLLASCVFIALAVGTLNRSALHRINLGLNYFLKRAGYYYLQGDYDRAAQAYTREIEREPQHADHYLGRAACFMHMLQKERAVTDIERARKISPDNVMALQLRGELFAMEKNYNAALELYARSQELNSNWAIPYFDRGSVFLDQREFQAALEQFTKAISLLAQFPLFHVIRSMVLFRLGELNAAHKDQDTAVRLSEKDSLTMYDINMQVYEGYLDWAEDFYARFLLGHARSWHAYQGRADAYRVNREYEKGIADYTRAIQINPREARLHLGRGRCYQALNEAERAAADFRQSLMLTDKLHLRRQAEDLLKTMPGD